MERLSYADFSPLGLARGPVKVRRYYAGGPGPPPLAGGDELQAVNDRYDRGITNLGEWDALRSPKGETVTNRIIAQLVLAAERLAEQDDRVVTVDRTQKTPPLLDVPPEEWLPDLDAPAGLGGALTVLEQCGHDLNAVFETMETGLWRQIQELWQQQPASGVSIFSDYEAYNLLFSSIVPPVEAVSRDVRAAVDGFKHDHPPAPRYEGAPPIPDFPKGECVEDPPPPKPSGDKPPGPPPEPPNWDEELKKARQDALQALDDAWGLDKADALFEDLAKVFKPDTRIGLLKWLDYEYRLMSALERQAAREAQRAQIQGGEVAAKPMSAGLRWRKALGIIVSLAGLGRIQDLELRRALLELGANLHPWGYDVDSWRKILQPHSWLPNWPIYLSATIMWPDVYPADKAYHPAEAGEIGPEDLIPLPGYSPLGVFWWRQVISPSPVKHILRLEDTADFHVTDLLRIYGLFKMHASRERQLIARDWIPDEVFDYIELSLRRFKYWLEDPFSPQESEMTFWSENHQLQFAAGEYLVGQFWPEARFHFAGMTGEQHRQRAAGRLRTWLERRLKFGFSEWNAPGYYNEDVPPLMNLIDFCQDPELRTLALMVADRLVFDLARFTCQGSFGVVAGRAYLEHKTSGWGQSVGDFIEVLFGTRGDIVDTHEPTACSFVTSSYVDLVPEVLIAIGQERRYETIDRSRVSIELDESQDHGIGFDGPDDLVFWWGNGAYFTSQTYDNTETWAKRWHLEKSGPFSILYFLENHWFRLGEAAASGAAAGLFQAGAITLLPFPLNCVAFAVSVPMVLRSVVDFLTAAADLIMEGIEDAWDGVLNAFGVETDDDDAPRLNKPQLMDALRKMNIEFNKGSVLSRACLYTYRGEDAMLSSVIDHHKGEFSFQKNVCQATLGPNVHVWTTKPFGDPNMFPANWRSVLQMVKELPQSVWQNLVGVFGLGESDPLPQTWLLLGALPAPLSNTLRGNFGHNGPNWWTGYGSLPLVWQQENVAVMIYNPTNIQRIMCRPITHAWFPQHACDELRWETVDEGTWVIGRRDRRQPPRTPCPPGKMETRDELRRAGSGYVALFSAQPLHWGNQDDLASEDIEDSEEKKYGGDRPGWLEKELVAEGHSNVWVLVIGDQEKYDSFEDFVKLVKDANVSVTGLGGLGEITCELTMPEKNGKRKFKVGWDSGASLEDEALSTDDWPLFENPYVAGDADGTVGWGNSTYRIVYPPGMTFQKLWLEHDFTGAPQRRMNRMVKDKRLKLGSMPGRSSNVPKPG